jgi:hypothetical protein
MNIQIASFLDMIPHNVAPHYPYFLQKTASFILKKKELGSSETSENVFHSTRLHTPEDGFF